LNALITAALGSALVIVPALATYEYRIAAPARQVGIVDVAGVYQAKERELANQVIAGDDKHRERAVAVAQAFAERFPAALDQVAADCECLVIVKSAVAAGSARAADWTDRFREILEGR
jgi:hypothetical protein